MTLSVVLVFVSSLALGAVDLGAALSLTSTSMTKDAPGVEYYWSSTRGNFPHYSTSSSSAPFNLTTPTWSWHDPRGLWYSIPVGTAIDDKKNIYLTVADGMHKFSPDGKLIWTHSRRKDSETIHQACSLWNGQVFCMSAKGRAFSFSMETGNSIWSTDVFRDGDGNYGHVGVHDGVVLVAGETSGNLKRAVPSCCGTAPHKLSGLNATNGRVLWTYEPDVPMWASNPSFADDGTFIFQNLEGTVHRSRLRDGSLVWKAGGEPGTWTDGSATLGPNGIIYAVSNRQNGGEAPGYLSAYALGDGQLLWKRSVPKPPNQAPVVARVAGHPGLSVVQPMGQQCMQGLHVDVRAYDAATGELRWTWEGPAQKGPMVAGDKEGIKYRMMAKIQPVTLPHPSSSPSVDADGTTYIGIETGHFLALRDSDGDGRVAGDQEVSVFETGAAFVGSAAAAVAPGLLAIGSLNQLFVWKAPTLHAVPA
mmetsp:Transcript_14104/g.40305  ORF Transcript_14104/g.40305 Transcript_14104/m.40305 type:complete len:476 (-) Transcript_14104:123-1550(-)